MTEKERIAELKKKFLSYYSKLPKINLAAAKIGRSEDTISLWRKSDSEFSGLIDEAKADWAMSKVGKIRDDKFLLERILRDDFSPRNEVTTPEGIQILIKDYGIDNNTTAKTGKDNKQ